MNLQVSQDHGDLIGGATLTLILAFGLHGESSHLLVTKIII